MEYALLAVVILAVVGYFVYRHVTKVPPAAGGTGGSTGGGGGGGFNPNEQEK